MKEFIKRLYYRLVYGKITYKVVATVGDNIAAEIEYYDRNKKVIGYWAYGYFDPNLPYKGYYGEHLS